MTPEDVRNFYKSTYNFHRMTGMSPVNLCNWLKKGRIPRGTQARLQLLTNGQLLADMDVPVLMNDALIKELEELRHFKKQIESLAESNLKKDENK